MSWVYEYHAVGRYKLFVNCRRKFNHFCLLVSSVVVLASRRLLRPRCEAQQPRSFPTIVPPRVSVPPPRAIVPRRQAPQCRLPQ